RRHTRSKRDWSSDVCSSDLKLFPPIVIGPMIVVIGLGLSATAVQNAGFVAGGDWRQILTAVVTFAVAVFITCKGKGFAKVIPFRSEERRVGKGGRAECAGDG